MIRPDNRPAIVLSDIQLKKLDKIAREKDTSINNEILQAINNHIKCYENKILNANPEMKIFL